MLYYFPNLPFAVLLLLYGVAALLDPELANTAYSGYFAVGVALVLIVDAALAADAARRKQQAQAQQRRYAHYQAVVDQRMAELQGMGRPPRDPRLN